MDDLLPLIFVILYVLILLSPSQRVLRRIGFSG